MPDAVRFTDARGLSWVVYEIPATRIPRDDLPDVEATPPHLTFERTGGGSAALRRLLRYPADWRERSDAELETLCEQAAPAIARSAGSDTADTRRHVDELTT